MADRIAQVMASDKAMRMMGYLTAGLVLLMMVLLGLSVPNISANTEASRRTDDLASCRASYRAAVDDATVLVFDTYGRVQDAVGSATVAAIRQDPTSLALIAAEIESAVLERQAAIRALFEANEVYDAAVELSSADPDRFLDDCQETG